MSDSGETVDPRLNAINSSLYRLAVKAVIVRDHRLLLVKELDSPWWSLPGGGVDHGETPLQALSRELSEELGVQPHDVETDGRIILASTLAVVAEIPRANLYYAAKLNAEPALPTIDASDCKWVNTEELAHIGVHPSNREVLSKLIELLL